MDQDITDSSTLYLSLYDSLWGCMTHSIGDLGIWSVCIHNTHRICQGFGMKRILAPILLLTLLFPTFAFGEMLGDLVYRGGLYYKKFTTVPFTGKVTGRFQGAFRNGKEHGPWVSYHENGQLFNKGIYKNGKKHGPSVSYWKNGQLNFKGTYKDDKTHGPWVFYNETGKVIRKGD